MDKTQKNGYKKYYYLFAIEAIVLIIAIVLFVFSVISLLTFLISLVFDSLIFMVSLYVVIKKKKKNVKKINSNKEKIIITDQDIIALYGSVGIPIIRDEEGKIKDIFNLLGLEMTFDEYGNRLKTIYELLGIIPRFTKDGKEIPTFMVIKNRVKGFIKPKEKTGILTRTLTEEQKEELLLKQMLEQKLKESEEKGDDKKAKVIKKVIDQKKKEKEKSNPPKKDGFIIIKPNVKSIKSSSSKFGQIKSNGNFIYDFYLMTKASGKYQPLSIGSESFKPDEKDKPKTQGFSTKVETPETQQVQTTITQSVNNNVHKNNSGFIYGLKRTKKIESEIKLPGQQNEMVQ